MRTESTGSRVRAMLNRENSCPGRLYSTANTSSDALLITGYVIWGSNTSPAGPRPRNVRGKSEREKDSRTVITFWGLKLFCASISTLCGPGGEVMRAATSRYAEYNPKSPTGTTCVSLQPRFPCRSPKSLMMEGRSVKRKTRGTSDIFSILW